MSKLWWATGETPGTYSLSGFLVIGDIHDSFLLDFAVCGMFFLNMEYNHSQAYCESHINVLSIFSYYWIKQLILSSSKAQNRYMFTFCTWGYFLLLIKVIIVFLKR